MGLFDIASGLFGGGDEVTVDAPDPNEVIRRSAQVNRVDQITPFGRVNFEGPDRNTLRFSLSPELQSLFDEQIGFGSQAAGMAGGLLSSIPGSMDAATEALLSRLEPRFQMREDQLRSRLENLGQPAAFGSAGMAEGAFDELSLLNQERNDARLAALLAGPQFQGQLIGNARGLASASPISVPQFNFQGATPVDVGGAYGLNLQAQGFNAQAAAQQQSDFLGGLFDLGTAFLAM